MTQYKFEEDLAKNELSMDIINARRFASSVRKAMRLLQQEAGCYHLNDEQYCRDTQAFLAQMASRLEAAPQQQ